MSRFAFSRCSFLSTAPAAAGSGWRFLSPEAALEELLPRVDVKPDATLLLSHLGLAADRDLAGRFPGLSAIAGGHSHDTLEKPEFIGSVPIVHAGPYARYVGRLELAVEDGGTRLISYRLVPLLETAEAAR
jgi:5'-nucleotidase